MSSSLFANKSAFAHRSSDRRARDLPTLAALGASLVADLGLRSVLQPAEGSVSAGGTASRFIPI
jgi:hypothetical protein